MLARWRIAAGCATLLAASVLAIASCGGGGGDGAGADAAAAGAGRFLVGAHYYVWYPSNFDQGFLRNVLEPPQQPALGRYSSRNPATAAQHISWATAHGIDFFTLDWWPDRPSQNTAIGAGFLRAANVGDIRFCIFYNTFGLGYSEAGGGIRFDEATKNRFVSDLVTIARTYFGHPSYLRIDGRPAIVLYITRTIRGLFPQAMAEMRAALAAEGYDPFVIGDEIFWLVVEANDDPNAPAVVTPEPQRSRIRLFDAITSYNLYDSSRDQDRGYGSESRFLPDVAALYGRYRKAGVPLVPGIIPGFNDRGTRPGLDHFAIPRLWAPGAAEGSFFAESIERIAKPFAAPDLRMVLITSWNEWNEDTAIEPVTPAPPTTNDRRGGFFTQGFAYEGFGTTYLEIVRDNL